MVRHYAGVYVRGSLVGFCGLSARRVLLKHPHCPRNPSFRVKTALELIAYAKANPGKITMGSHFSVRPPVAPTKLEDLKQRNHQLEPLRGRAAQGARKNAARFKREIEFDRRRPANSRNKSSTQLRLILDTLILNAGAAGGIVLRVLGQFVVTGEPVAVMGGGAQSAVAQAGGASQSVLYVEFRKDGIPVDPGPWWAANEGQKVRG
jgi:hypothetical protein